MGGGAVVSAGRAKMRKHSGYLALIEFDDEANLFHGEAVNL
jgi:predicted HicB family RNase H-like nuclease